MLRAIYHPLMSYIVAAAQPIVASAWAAVPWRTPVQDRCTVLEPRLRPTATALFQHRLD